MTKKYVSRLSLTQELTISVVAIFLLMIVFLTLFVGQALTRSNEEKIEWLKKSNLQVAKSLLVDQVWTLDINSIKNSTAIFVGDENQIVAIRVLDQFGEVLADNRSAKFKDIDFKSLSIRKNHFLDRSDIYKFNQRIGSVEFIYSSQKFNDDLVWLIVKLGFSFMAIGLSFGSIILWRFGKTITEPVNRIVKNSQKIVEGNYQFQAEEESVLEFQKITNVLNLAIRAIDERDTELKQQIQRAESATSAKSHFVSSMSHEIRTPLNAIIGLTELVLEGPLDEETNENLTIVKLSADSLLSIINDILDFSKIEAGKLELESIRFEMLETLEECEKILGLIAKKKQVQLKMIYPKNSSLVFIGDPLRLKQILLNLLNNAIKFTPAEGEVSLKISLAEVKEDSTLVRFEVKDNGIGIEKSKLINLFEPFSQEDQSTTRKYGGTGLGLSITKKIITQMNGVIGIESELGVGSLFWFQVRFQNTKS